MASLRNDEARKKRELSVFPLTSYKMETVVVIRQVINSFFLSLVSFGYLCVTSYPF